MPTGSPKFRPSYIRKVKTYLKLKKDRVSKRIKSDGEKTTTWEHVLSVDLPSIEDFAKYIKIARSTIYEWEKVNEKFKIALDEIRTEQKKRLINSGLSGAYNPVIAKLILSSDHGMREKIDATSDDKPINNFSDDQIERIARRVLNKKH